MNRIIFVFMFFIVVLGIVVAIPYGKQFGFYLSDKSEEWANFATYFTGIVSPVIAAVTLFGIWLTIDQQNKQLIESKKITNISLLENTIVKIESDFISTLKDTTFVLNVDGDKLVCSYFEVLMSPLFLHWEKVIPNLRDIDPSEKYNISDAKHFEQFIMAAGHLNQLRIYVNKHAQVSGTNTQSKYYARRYELAYTRLKESGYWKDDEGWIVT